MRTYRRFQEKLSYQGSRRYKALQTLARARFDVIQNLTREKQWFANYLFLKCSGIAQDKDIQNTSTTTIALMEHFEAVDDLANADLNKPTAFIAKSNRGDLLTQRLLQK